MTRNETVAFSYARTSSAANVEGDSEARQLDAINAYAKRTGISICGHWYDGAVSGADHVELRAGFSALLTALGSSPVGVVIVEAADRFARDLLTQEAGIAKLRAIGVRLITASGDDLTESNDPSRVMVRQILGAVAQHDKARVVAKLRSGRDAKRAQTGRCEGRKPAPDAAIALARELHAKPVRPSLRTIAARLADAGFLAPCGQPYGPSSVRCMVR